MDVSWFFQWLVTKFLEWGVPLLGTLLIAWWKKQEKPWINTVLYGLVAFTCLWLLFGPKATMLVTSPNSEATKTEIVDNSTLEERITKWAYGYGYSVRRVDATEKQNFNLVLNSPSAYNTVVSHTKKHERYVMLVGSFSLSDSIQKLYKALPKNEQN